MKASLNKRKGSPYYYIRWWDKTKKKPGVPVSTRCENLRDAEKFKKKWVEQKEQEEREGYSFKPLTIDELKNIYLRDKANKGEKLKDGTVSLYLKTIKRLNQVVPETLPISLFTKEHYHKFVESLDGISQNTKAMYTNKLYALFRFAVKEKFIKEIPVGRVAEVETDFYIMSEEEAKLIISKSKETIYYNLFRFLFTSAFRIHEALKLKKEDIKDGYIYVLGKGSKKAHIPIYNSIQEVFNDLDLDNLKSKDKIFPFTYDQIRMFLSRLRPELNSRIKIHDIRRYCLSRMANNGVPINFVKTFARHSNIATTLKYYVKTDMTKLSQELNRVNFIDLF